MDSSSGYMANGVSLGRPETPPIIRIRVPSSEVLNVPQRSSKQFFYNPNYFNLSANLRFSKKLSLFSSII